MAEEKLQYTLTLATHATGTGAKDTAADLNRVATAKDKVDAVSRGGNSLERFMERTAVSTRAAYAEVHVLGAELDQVGKKAGQAAPLTESLSTGVTKVGKSTGDASRSLLMFSQRFEDAQYGMRGVLNNIPGLVMALGGTAGIAGAISIAAVSFSVLFEWLNKTEEKASDTAETAKRIGDAVKGWATEDLNKAMDDIKAIANQEKLLKNDYVETQKAENTYATAAITNSAAIADAGYKINEMLGLQTDAAVKAKEAADLGAQSRAEALAQALEAEQNHKNQANKELREAKGQLDASKELTGMSQIELDKEREKLTILREQKATREKMAADFAKSGGMMQYMPIPYLAKKFAGDDVARQLSTASAVGDPKTAQTEARVAALEASIEAWQLTHTGDLARLADAVAAAQNKSDDITKAADINIAKLRDGFETSNIVAKTNEVVEAAQTSAKDLQAAVMQMQPATAAQQAAKDAILKATADSMITANEQQGVALNLSTLISGLQSGVTTTNGNVQDLIKIGMMLQTQQGAAAGEINRLKADVERLKYSLSTRGPAQ